MSTKQLTNEIPCDESVATYFKALVDVTTFEVVKSYVRHPDSAISFVVLLKDGYRIEQLAAAICGPRRMLILEENLFEVTTIVDPAQLAKYPDEQRCRVIYLPPAYLVQAVPDPE